MVVSGINHGANLGDDVLYSGTVAAAMEGRFLGLPAIAVSLVSEQTHHFDTAASMVYKIIEGMMDNPLPSDTILNINVPDRPIEAIGGIKVTRLGGRYRPDPVVLARDPKGRPVYWIGPAGEGQDAGPGTDFDAIANGFVSVTPIKVDLTDHSALDLLENWLKHLK
jgi:5'-nucleotidase